MSPYAFYQFWLNVGDAEVPGLLKVFTFRSREEIEDLERQTAERPPARAGQRTLAEDVTKLVHSADATARVIAASRALFGQGDLHESTSRPWPTRPARSRTPRSVLRDPDEALPPVTDLMAVTGIAASKSAARRAVTEGGAYLNNTRVTEQDAVPTRADLLHGRYLILRRGKRTVGAVDVHLA